MRWVTGAGRGIGAAIAEALAAAGAELHLVARDLDGLTAIADRLADESGRSVMLTAADVSTAAGVRRCVRRGR